MEAGRRQCAAAHGEQRMQTARRSTKHTAEPQGNSTGRQHGQCHAARALLKVGLPQPSAPHGRTHTHALMAFTLHLQVAELDYNNDGKPDVIDFRATVAGGSPVHGVKALLQFTYSLTVGWAGAGVPLLLLLLPLTAS